MAAGNTIYTGSHRTLQDEFATRALADRLEEAIVTTELNEDQTDYIHSRNLFFLSTLDELGQPTVSYKGGAPGFVRALNPGTLVFPIYDGNGMFLSAGNIEATAKLGMLFIDFEAPRRLRLQGSARLLRDGPILRSYPGALLAVEVQIGRLWVNCPRYIHKMHVTETSTHVPAADGTYRFAAWKRIDVMQDVLTPEDRTRAQLAGLITIEAYEALVGGGNT